MDEIEKHYCCNGWLSRYQHYSNTLNCTMRFAVYLPDKATVATPVPVVYWLSGLTCTEENFIQKAGALRFANELNIAIVVPDTSPRGEGVADHPDYDLGQGAGFYLNATQMPWSEHYQMYDYVVEELPRMIEQHLPVTDQRSLSGHSMGGHGALVIGLRHPERYQSVSAFSPICQPSKTPWGKKAFSHYLGDDVQSWLDYDACHLLSQQKSVRPIRIDQGEDDEWLTTQLNLDAFTEVAQAYPDMIKIYRHENYDHSYYFISSFIGQHLKFHASHLQCVG